MTLHLDVRLITALKADSDMVMRNTVNTVVTMVITAVKVNIMRYYCGGGKTHGNYSHRSNTVVDSMLPLFIFSEYGAQNNERILNAVHCVA